MSGIFDKTDRRRVVCVAATIALLAPAGAATSQDPLPVTRQQMVDTAKGMAEHKWICRVGNLKASCLKQYKSRFTKDQEVVGVAYDWGGMDDRTVFDKKLAKPLAAGSHQEEGVSDCTAGVDCSGLLSLCWGQTKKFGTSTIGEIAPTLKDVNVLTDLKVGDALNKPGSHIVMFVGYNADGTIDVYEAAGSRSRVVLTKAATWARFKQYVPIRYKGTVD
jgi:hypothetical protein